MHLSTPYDLSISMQYKLNFNDTTRVLREAYLNQIFKYIALRYRVANSKAAGKHFMG